MIDESHGIGLEQSVGHWASDEGGHGVSHWIGHSWSWPCECLMFSGTTTEFCIPDHWVQAAVMVKIFELFRTLSRFTRLNR